MSEGERNCPDCIWHGGDGCTSWDCEYLSREEARKILPVDGRLTEREMRVAAMAIMTYCYISQTDTTPDLSEDGHIEIGVVLDSECFEKALALLSEMSVEDADLWAEEVDDGTEG